MIKLLLLPIFILSLNLIFISALNINIPVPTNYSLIPTVNSSEYWDGLDTFNSTQMENSNGKLNILESWFSTLFDVLFGNKDTDDLTQGSVNLYDNQSWNESYADSLYWDINLGSANATYDTAINNASYLSTFNSTYNSYSTNVSLNWSELTFNAFNITWSENPILNFIDTNASSCGVGEYLDGDGKCYNLNNSIDTRTASITYYPTSYFTIEGTESGGNNIANLSFFDSNTFNITEDAGVNPLLFYVNFSGVTETPDFLTMAHQYIGTHSIELFVWDYGMSEWELYDTINSQGSILKDNIALIDGANHVSGGVVQLKFDHIGSGNINHLLRIDAVNIVHGFSTVTTTAHDGLSGRNNQATNHLWAMPINSSLNLNTTGNVTASFLVGDGSQLTNLNSGAGEGKFNSTSWNRTGTNVSLANTGDKVGIGTITPLAKLHIASGNITLDNNFNYEILDADGTPRNIVKLNNGNDLYIGDINLNSIYFSVNGSLQPVIIQETTGYVGIGTSPVFELQVIGDNNPTIQIGGTLSQGSTNGSSMLRFRSNNGIQDNIFDIKYYKDANQDRLTFSDAIANEILTLKNGGQVGIGTITPSSKLEVAKGSNVNEVNLSGVVYVNSTSGKVSIGMTNPRRTLEVNGQIFVNGSSGSIGLYSRNGTGSVFEWYNPTGEDLRLYTGYDRVTIKSNGDFGIGTTNPNGLLHINGINSTKSGLVLESSGAVINNRLIDIKNTGGSFRIGMEYDNSNINLNIVNRTRTALVTFREGGNVGIGTTVPGVKLEVITSTQGTDGLQVKNNNGGWLRFLPNTGNGIFNTFVSAGDSGIVFTNGTKNFGRFVITPWSDTEGGLVMDTSGNVGIGTATPTELLQVGSRTITPTILIKSSDIAGGTGRIIFRTPYSSVDYDGSITSSWYSSTGMTFTTPRDLVGRGFSFNSKSGSTKMIIDTGNGNVGIGITTPQYPLHIGTNTSQANQSISIFAKGNITATGFITRTSIFDKTKGSAFDFIKDSDYYKTEGEIDHNKFYGYTSWTTADIERPIYNVTFYDGCENVFNETLNESIKICNPYNITDVNYPYQIENTGVSLNEEVDALRQGLFELNERVKYLEENCVLK